jgi:hypothetical protein
MIIHSDTVSERSRELRNDLWYLSSLASGKELDDIMSCEDWWNNFDGEMEEARVIRRQKPCKG